jgi:hypothetical protein|tara:strand:+ start:565 stop:735 length:171 start_codon:yes stop_codon:yes gene_type:complete
MQTNLLEKRIEEVEHWLELNEGQMFLPTMDEDDLLHKKEVKHQKETLDLLKQLKNS